MAEHLQPGLHFRGIGFQEIPVEVQVVCCHTPAHLLRTVLVDPVIGTKPFMPVNIENGDKQN